MTTLTRKEHAAGIAQYCTMDKRTLMRQMSYYTVNDDGGYLGILLRPGARILAIAHIDHHKSGTVHKATSKLVVSSALDDRLGVYIAMEVLPQLGVTADVLLCDEEESANTSIRSVGMDFLNRYNWMMELDYPGTGAAVYRYQSMVPWVKQVYGEANLGCFTDITEIEHYSPIGAFNAGVGYQKQHSEQCVVKMHDFDICLLRIQKMCKQYGHLRATENDDIVLEEYMPQSHRRQMFNRFNTDDWCDDYNDRAYRYNTNVVSQKELECALCNCDLPWYVTHSEYEGHKVCNKCYAILTNETQEDSTQNETSKPRKIYATHVKEPSKSRKNYGK